MTYNEQISINAGNAFPDVIKHAYYNYLILRTGLKTFASYL